MLYEFCRKPLQKLQREAKRVRLLVREVEVISREVDVIYKDIGTTIEDMETTNEKINMIDLVRAIEAMTRIFYKREHIKKEGPIYLYDKLWEYLENLLDQLHLAARPLERSEKTMDHIKKLIVYIFYLLASLNNTKINSFKLDVAYYLDSVSISNEGLDMLANLSVALTSRSVD
ncbi:3970_t:CDS:2 [Gigaspora margarita]|uniref:3970_t:CDS:1 n=1 Tax=Gigaspora margarita TaxID=4874 RepID=A0ABN7V8C6_GIGMA|nr:3970_t:CDS:2 [Gigaspora margarita]